MLTVHNYKCRSEGSCNCRLILAAEWEMKICNQQIEIVMRHPPAISIYGYVGGRQM